MILTNTTTLELSEKVTEDNIDLFMDSLVMATLHFAKLSNDNYTVLYNNLIELSEDLLADGETYLELENIDGADLDISIKKDKAYITILF